MFCIGMARCSRCTGWSCFNSEIPFEPFHGARYAPVDPTGMAAWTWGLACTGISSMLLLLVLALVRFADMLRVLVPLDAQASCSYGISWVRHKEIVYKLGFSDHQRILGSAYMA